MSSSIAALLQLQRRLAQCGLDIFRPFSIATYNRAVPKEYALPSGNSPNGDRLAILVGNTKRIWKPFIESLSESGHSDPSTAIPNPFDTYVVQSVRNCLTKSGFKHVKVISDDAISRNLETFPRTNEKLASESRRDVGERSQPELEVNEVRFSFDTRPGKLVALQRLAHAIGFGYYDLNWSLVTHPTLGSWFGLRSVIIFDAVHDGNPVSGHTVIEHLKAAAHKRFLDEESQSSLEEKTQLEYDQNQPQQLDMFFTIPSPFLEPPISPNYCNQLGCDRLHADSITQLLQKKMSPQRALALREASEFKEGDQSEAMPLSNDDSSHIYKQHDAWAAPGVAWAVLREECFVGREEISNPGSDINPDIVIQAETNATVSGSDCASTTKLACSPWRYYDAQLLYHYSGQKSILRLEVDRLRLRGSESVITQ